jgi:hypothetical protein
MYRKANCISSEAKHTFSMVLLQCHFESGLHWFESDESDEIGIMSGLVHVEFQKFVTVL